MSLVSFAWKPDLGASQAIKPTVNPTKFGDGYELRVPNGINSRPKKWTLTFTKNLVEASQILDFLYARGGSEAFQWIDPMGAEGTYVCREWESRQQDFGIYAVSATFEQVFER